MQNELKKTEKLVDKIQDQIQDLSEVSGYSFSSQILSFTDKTFRRSSLPPPK